MRLSLPAGGIIGALIKAVIPSSKNKKHNMTDTAISVQGLGKQYIIGHKKEGDYRYSLRDKLKVIYESLFAFK